jgi:hypothetical protein
VPDHLASTFLIVALRRVDFSGRTTLEIAERELHWLLERLN